MKDWPLILFTLAIQVACGLTLAATAFDAMANPGSDTLMRPLALAIFPLVAAGLLSSMVHLGRPWTAWRAVTNWRRSRLSREVLLTTLFAMLSAVYSGFWWMGTAGGRLALGAATSVAGIAAVVAAALPYRIPAKPVWNSGWVVASFLGTAVLLGGLVPGVLVSWGAETRLLRVYLGATAAGSLLLLIAAWWMIANLSRRTGDRFAATRLARLLQSAASRKIGWLGCYVAFACLLPVAVAVRLWPEEQAAIPPFAGAIVSAVVFGAAIGRSVMYWLGEWYEPF